MNFKSLYLHALTECTVYITQNTRYDVLAVIV